jgi:hypothetical protein
LLLFLRPDQYNDLSPQIDRALQNNLPYTFRGYSTHFGEPDAADGGVRVLQDIQEGPVGHLVMIRTLDEFWRQELGFNPLDEPTPADWLTFQEHRLLSLTTGGVFHDDLRLAEIRQRFAYYPQQVWYYLLAAQWSLISQEEAFVGRTSQAGDELGSRIVAARLVERMMRLCFLMEKRYAPYSKWFGTAFQRLACAPILAPLLESILSAPDFSARDQAFAQVYTQIAEMHNSLGITPALESRTRTYSGWHMLRSGVDDLALDDPFNTRPFQVIFGGRYCDAIANLITDPDLLKLRKFPGSVNQFLVESSDALQDVEFCQSLKANLHTSKSE